MRPMVVSANIAREAAFAMIGHVVLMYVGTVTVSAGCAGVAGGPGRTGFAGGWAGGSAWTGSAAASKAIESPIAESRCTGPPGAVAVRRPGMGSLSTDVAELVRVCPHLAREGLRVGRELRLERRAAE